MSSLAKTKVFNRPDAIVEGWYWAMPSKELKKGQIKHLNFLGEELAIARLEDGTVRSYEAYCPHMGAHLAEGKVEGQGVRCFFHHWKFNGEGELDDIPCRKGKLLDLKIKHYPTQEEYGMIWIWTGLKATKPIPYIPELLNTPLDYSHGNCFIKKCHPNVVMINAIDAHHFTSVHNLPVDVKFDTQELNENCITFENRTTIPRTQFLLKFFSKFYSKYLTYNMCYWNGSTGSVTVGPDFLHCHIIFALKPTKEGYAHGQTILVTPKRKGILRLFNPIILFATKLVGNYFAKGDTQVFETIKFSFQNPIKEDDSIIKFIQHTEKMKCASWGFAKNQTSSVDALASFEDVTATPSESPKNLKKASQS